METVNMNHLIKLDFQANEAFKTLRSNIQFCGDDIKVIGLTSSLPNEGKSSVSLNLAVSLAESGKYVALIDADLRKSVMIGRYRIDKPVKGLTHYLSGLNSQKDVIYSTNIDNLDVVFSGPVPPNPSELLGVDKFSDLIKDLRKIYDYIIIDTPPLGSVIDSAVVSKVCDGMIIIIQANAVSQKIVKKTKAQLERTGCRILGAVLNNVETGRSGYYGKYYGYY